jgi:TatD DNase family protein
MPASLVDFHCHLDLYPDLGAAIGECERKRVYTLAVTTTPKAWPRNRDLAAPTRYVRAALGLHPQLVAERANEISLWEEYLPQAKYVGEVGLDAGPKFYRTIDLQKTIFKHILQCCARTGGKVLTVHSVRSAAAVMDLIEDHLPIGNNSVVLHWFSGSRSDARRAVELGCYFSVNANMMETERGRNLVYTLPLDRILTETDGPFTRVGDRFRRPEDVCDVLYAVAQVHHLTSEEMAERVSANLRRVALVESVGGPTHN